MAKITVLTEYTGDIDGKIKGINITRDMLQDVVIAGKETGMYSEWINVSVVYCDKEADKKQRLRCKSIRLKDNDSSCCMDNIEVYKILTTPLIQPSYRDHDKYKEMMIFYFEDIPTTVEEEDNNENSCLM